MAGRYVRANTVHAFIGYPIDALASLREGHSWDSRYRADICRLDRLGLPVTRRARFGFPVRGIEARRLRELI